MRATFYDVPAKAASNTALSGDCSKATGPIQRVNDGVRRGFVAGLRLGHHATYPAQDAPESALAFVPGRHSFASCDSADCRVPPPWTSRVAACRQETSALCPTWGQRASSACHRGRGTAGHDAATW